MVELEMESFVLLNGDEKDLKVQKSNIKRDPRSRCQRKQKNLGINRGKLLVEISPWITRSCYGLSTQQHNLPYRDFLSAPTR